jgi:hypothetical protein
VAFALQNLSVLTNALCISYCTDKICNSFHNAQNEQHEIIFCVQAGNTLYKKVVYLRHADFLDPRVQDEMSEELAEEALITHQGTGSENSG